MYQTSNRAIIVRIVGAPRDVEQFIEDVERIRPVYDKSPEKRDFEVAGRVRVYLTVGGPER